MLKEFDIIMAYNKKVLFLYLQRCLWSSIQAQINSQHQELDFWEEVLDKAI